MKTQYSAAIVAVTTATAAMFIAQPASAQRAKPNAQITVTNLRAAPLTTFEIATTGDQPRLVAKIAKPLLPGKSATLRLSKPVGCSYFVLARFDDAVESDSEGMDLCKDRVIRLLD